MVVEVVFGAVLVVLALCAGLGGPLLAAHLQRQSARKQLLGREIDNQRIKEAASEATAGAYRK